MRLGLGNKRSFGDLDDDEDDIFGSKKANVKVEQTAPGVASGMILSLLESLQNCQEELSTCQTKHNDVKSEIQKWHSSFQSESFIPAGQLPLEKAKKKEAAFIVTFAKWEQEIAELKDYAIKWRNKSMMLTVDRSNELVVILQEKLAEEKRRKSRSKL